MADLIYSAIGSLDGYLTDASGGFAWAEPDDEVHSFINAQERTVGTYLYGRRMYETMAAWETEPSLAEASAPSREFAELWQGAEKVVYSTTLVEVSTRRTRLERHFDTDAVRRLKEEAAADLTVSGAGLAGSCPARWAGRRAAALRRAGDRRRRHPRPT